jgi:hypothetical protein
MRIHVASVVLLVLAGTGVAQPVRVHAANPRYYEWRGKPVVFVTAAEHYGAVLNPDFNFGKYLDTMQRDRMNYTRIFIGSYVEPVGAFGIERNTLAPAAGQFLAPWQRSATPGYAGGGMKFDLDRWDSQFLERLKAFVAAADARNIAVEITLFCSTYGDRQWAVHPFHPTNTISNVAGVDWKKLHTLSNANMIAHQRRLARYLAREMNAYDNIIWEIQNEPWADQHDLGETINAYLTDRKTFPNRIEVTAPASVAWQTEIVQAIRDEERNLPKKHIILQNVANFRLAIRPDLDLARGIDGVHFHYAFPEAATWNAGLKMPVGCDETGFAGPVADVYRKQAWAFLFAGGALWNHLDYSFSVGKEDGTDRQPKSPGSGGPELRKQLRFLSEFLNGLDLTRLAPDRSAVLNSPGVVCSCLSVPGRQYAAYLQGRGPTTLTIALPAEEYTADWFDITTGAKLHTQTRKVGTGPTDWASPNFTDEIAVRIVRVGAK